jgi:hypothetical protein
MRSRVDDIESGTYAHSGVYMAADGRKLLLSPRRANGYALRIFKLPDANVASLDEASAAMWDGPDRDGCTLRLAPSPLSIRVWQKGTCGGRDYSGSYRRDLAQTLADYEFELF